MKTIRIIIADDHPVMLQGFAGVIKGIPEFTLLAEASDGNRLVECTRKLNPDIVITDISMPLMDGIAATMILSKEFPSMGIIAFSMFDSGAMISKIIEAGAKGYLSKNSDVTEIITAIQTVHNGGYYYNSNIVFELAKMVRNKNGGPTFSEKEIEVIKLICAERSSKQIAGDLCLSKRTIEWYKKKLFEKLDTKNTAGIVAYAVKNNICT